LYGKIKCCQANRFTVLSVICLFNYLEMTAEYKKLDNPAWYALSETHACFAKGTDELKRYDPDVVLFAGFCSENENVFDALDQVINLQDSFFLFDRFPALPKNYTIETVIECLQMVCNAPVPADITADIVLLNETNTDAMFSLVSEVFPGYYLRHTRRIGDYYGIFQDGKLAAMAGERLCMERFTEVSAVVTHPSYTGRKYAQQLVTQLTNKNMQAGTISFLHTGANNERGIKIYELPGY